MCWAPSLPVVERGFTFLYKQKSICQTPLENIFRGV
jgi:hypothetical protein